jgi:hypothetical protein
LKLSDIIEMESVAEGDYRKTEAASEQIHHEGRSLEQIIYNISGDEHCFHA